MIAAGERELVAAEAGPDLLPVAARLDLDIAELGTRLDDGAGKSDAGSEILMLGLRHGAADSSAGRAWK